MLELAKIFGDHMVLQRGTPLPVWGRADAGARVELEIQGKRAAATAGADGRWRAELPPLQTSFAETLTVAAGGRTRTLRDVQVGEVWLAGGQSNMEYMMYFDLDAESERPACADDALRFYDVPEIAYPGQDAEADYAAYGFWRKAGAQDLDYFSAVGYYFARALRRRYGIPVGIVGCNWGGTPACAWMSEQAVAKGGGQAYLDEYAAAVRGLDVQAYDHAFRADPANYRTDLLAGPVLNMMHAGARPADMAAAAARLGLADGWTPKPMGPKHEKRPGGLYEAMLKPLAPYAVRGVIWYQGETDAGAHPEAYRTLFPALIENWRALWGRPLPFLFVQLAPLERWMEADGAPYAVVRAAQQHTADTVPGTGMAVITDAGMRRDIHPKAKRPVGERLALLARHIAYGEEILCEAPTLAEVRPAEGRLTLRFQNAGAGLRLGMVTPYGKMIPACLLSGVTITQGGADINAGTLAAAVRGDTVTLTGAALHAAPTTVGVAQGGWYQVNLYNSAGLPARPAVAAG